MKRLGALLGFCLYVSHIVSYGYDVKVLKKWQPTLKCNQYWVGVCDFHDKTHPSNTLQRKKIEDTLPNTNKNDVLVIVEDLSSCNDAGRSGCGPYYINSKTGILAGLGGFCKDHHIPVCNVEYRYCRVVALGPVINNISADPNLFPSTKKMTVSSLLHEIEHAYTHLLLGNPHSLLCSACNEKAKHVQGTIKKLHLSNDHHKTIAEFLIDRTTPLNRLDMVKTLLTFDGIFIGLKIADASMKADSKKKIIVFAGGTHINEAYELLQKVGGYVPVTASDMHTGTPLSKAISTNAPEHYLSKPQPVSIELLEHYLKN